MRAIKSVPSRLSVLRPAILGVLTGFALSGSVLGQTTTPAVPAATARHTSVHFEDGLLTVTASNSSLNGILREIARSTGMKISGSVPEDRVFGTYGPEDPQRVLATLLDGTGTNILILSNDADKPLELVLSHRSGGITPPNPAEMAENDANDDGDNATAVRSASAPAVPSVLRTVGQRSPQGRNAPPVTGNQPSEVEQPVVFAPISPTTAPATATTTPANPDDASDPGTETVKTPQQIFEQLQNLQQGSGQGNGANQNPQ